MIEANRARARRFSARAASLAAHPRVRDFRHRGMIWAFEVDTDRPQFPRWCFEQALARGVLLRPIGRTVYFMPPYVIDDAEFGLVCDAAVEILDAA